ncbi:MAG: hypothetical protein ACM30E_04835 [Nitrososphaerales archaeon]
MKRFITIAVLAAVLAALLASTALAAGPVAGRWAQQGPTNAAGTCPMGGPGAMGGTGMQGRPAWAGQPDEVETLLGMTDAQIQAERLAGKSLAQIAASKNISEKELIETILATKTSAIQQAVSDGKLTQAQADAMIQNMQTMVKTMVERTTTGPMGGRGMGMRGQGTPGGGMRGQGMRGTQTF